MRLHGILVTIIPHMLQVRVSDVTLGNRGELDASMKIANGILSVRYLKDKDDIGKEMRLSRNSCNIDVHPVFLD